MKYNLSIYNIYFQTGEDLLIYNSLSNKYIMIEKCNINKLKELKNSIELNKSDLFLSGFITNNNSNVEQKLCDEVYFSYLNNNTLSITLITTRACNFRCQYCPQEHNNQFMSEDIYNRVTKFIIKNITNYNKIKITLFGGEPTLSIDYFLPFLDKINEICKYYKRKFEGVMISNGYLLTAQIIKELYKHNITQYQITLDGSVSNHNKNRPYLDNSETFDTIYNNLLYILDDKKLSRISVAIRINCTKELLDSIDDWYRFYEPFINDNRFLLNLGVVQDRGGKYIKSFNDILISETDDIYFLAKKKLSLHDFYENYMKNNYFICKDISYNSYTIDFDGRLRSCSNIYTDNIVGYLSENGNPIISINEKLQYLKTEQKCFKCPVEPLCHGKSCKIHFKCEKDSIINTIKNNADYSNIRKIKI